MGRVVGYFDGRHGIPTTYEQLPGFLTATHDLGEEGWARLQGYLDSRHSCPALGTPIKGLFHSQHTLNSTRRQSRPFTGAHALPVPVYRRGTVNLSHELKAHHYSHGKTDFRHAIIAGWARSSRKAQANHALEVYARGRGAIDSRHEVSVFLRAYRVSNARHELLARALTRWKLSGSYSISIPRREAWWLDSRHELTVLSRMAGPWTSAHALRAHERRRGALTARHALPVYVRYVGFSNGRHELLVARKSYGMLESRHAVFIDEFADELAGKIHSWAVNARTGAASRYKRFPFHGYASSFGGIGAASDGLYMLDGENDDGASIDGEFVTPLYDAHQPDVGGTLLKRIVAAVFGGNMDGIEVELDLDDEDHQVFTYRRGVGIQNHKRLRVKFHQGLKSRLFGLTVRNVEGGNFDIESVDVEVEHLPSRER
jgi:hypothetical protein